MAKRNRQNLINLLALPALVLLAILLPPAETRQICAKTHRRFLQQATTATPSSPSDLGQPYNSEGGALERVEIDVLQQECVVTFNFYTSPFVTGNLELATPQANIQSTASECCSSCHAEPGCNAWQWCPLESGCTLPANSTIPALRGPFPYMGCQLMTIAGFSPYVQDLTQMEARGPDVPFMAGALLTITVPEIESYQVLIGSDLGGLYDYSCDELGTRERCEIQGPPENAAVACNANPACHGFVYFPDGVTNNGTGPISRLKSDSADGELTDADAYLNPMAATYIKGSSQNASSENGGPSTAVIAVVGSVVGLFLIGGIIGMAIYVRRYRKMTRSFPQEGGGAIVQMTDPKPEDYIGASVLLESSSGDLDASSSSPGGSVRALSFQQQPPQMSSFPIMGMLQEQQQEQERQQQQQQHTMDHQNVMVSEVTPHGSSEPTSNPGGAIPPFSTGVGGSSARDLLEAFSQMYKQRPPLDYNCLAEMLEDGEAAAQAEIEASGVTAAAVGVAAGWLSSEDWKITPDEVEVCRRPDGSWWQLGTGAFGTVYKGLYHSVHSVAIKVLHRLEDQCHSDAFEREVMLLKALRHRNVVQFLGAALNGPQGTALLVTELMELGDLWRALPAKDPVSGDRMFSWKRRGRQAMEDVARGLHYLHSKRVVHFDLKSANILLSRAGTAKLADIGMARVLNKSYLSVVSSGLGTFAWSAPEVLSGRRCTEKADIYSFGVVLWEVCTGEAPVRGDMRSLRAPEDCPAEIVELYQRCVAEDPDVRPTAKELIEILAPPAGERG